MTLHEQLMALKTGDCVMLEELLVSVRKTAYELAVERYHSNHADADEIAQNVTITVYECIDLNRDGVICIDDLDEGVSLCVCAYAAAVRKRKEYTIRDTDYILLEKAGISVLTCEQYAIAKAELRSCVDALPDLQRQLIMCMYYEESFVRKLHDAWLLMRRSIERFEDAFCLREKAYANLRDEIMRRLLHDEQEQQDT